jgi:uncharacterized cupin superfamily protein
VHRANLLHDDCERSSEEYEYRDGFRWRETWVGNRLGAERIGASLYELPPGQLTFPYHFHYGNEEWLVVVTGEPTLRSPDGERRLRVGDVVCFPAGPDGAHQVRNDTEEPTRVLMISTLRSPDVVRYVDSDKLGVRPGVREDSLNFLRPAAVGYWENEP